MKKIIIITLFVITALSTYLNAQTFSFIRTSPPIVVGSGSDTVIKSNGKIINYTNTPINIRLHRDSVDVPFGWTTMSVTPALVMQKRLIQPLHTVIRLVNRRLKCIFIPIYIITQMLICM